MLVALTGRGSAEDKRKGVEAGFDLHLTKSVDPEAIEAAVARRAALAARPSPAPTSDAACS